MMNKLYFFYIFIYLIIVRITNIKNINKTMNNFKDSLIVETEQSNYKKQTFSGYKKTQVMTKLKQCILKQEIDRACIWGAELDISGHTYQLWEDLIIYGLTEINIINPNLPIYLLKKCKEFLRIYRNFEDFQIHIRNNQESRNKLCDLIVTIALIRFIIFTMSNS